jgi:hypothetical protein
MKPLSEKQGLSNPNRERSDLMPVSSPSVDSNSLRDQPNQGNRFTPRKKAPFTLEQLRSHLTRAAADLARREAYREIAASVQKLNAEAEDHYSNLEDLEQRLTMLEEKLSAIARSQQTKQDRSQAIHDLNATLRPYRNALAPEQLTLLERQYFDRWLLDKAGIPRLSLFYLDIADEKRPVPPDERDISSNGSQRGAEHAQGLQRVGDLIANRPIIPRLHVPGFGTVWEATLTIYRWAPETLPRNACRALLFHMERTIPYNKFEHTCSLTQMTHGLHKTKKKGPGWVRGGSGQSRSSNKLGNEWLIAKGLLYVNGKTGDDLKTREQREQNRRYDATKNGALVANTYGIAWRALASFFAATIGAKPGTQPHSRGKGSRDPVTPGRSRQEKRTSK